MTNNIYPPDHLLRKWESLIIDEEQNVDVVLYEAFQAGADQELEACCEWLQDPNLNVDTYKLRAARRPKPPSLKETLLARVARIPGEGADTAYLHHWLENESQRLVEALHKAIKSLPD